MQNVAKTGKNIPYRNLTWVEPRGKVTQPPDSWTGVRDSTKVCNICPQLSRETKTVTGDEDCLYLNVYTQRLNSTESELLPVMVFFHGGGFLFGQGTDDLAHGPDFLVEKNVVVVSINYRLGILGFLCLDNKEAPGNMGLMDQVQALKWIKNNIDKFGGDAKNVTVFGISAGGASVQYLLLSPMAKGLFHKAIAQSGSSLLHWAFNENIKSLASKIPLLHGIKITDNDELLKYLKRMPLSELIPAAMTVIAGEKFRGGVHFGFVPTVEKTGDWKPFLNENPYKLLAQGKFSKVPFMTGFCSREGLLMVLRDGGVFDEFVKGGYDFLKFLPFDLDNKDKSEIAIKLKKAYLEGDKLYNDQDAPAIEFFTDIDFKAGICEAANLIAKHSSPVYLYEFSYDGNLNYIKKRYNIKREGACHGDDGGYILKRQKLTHQPNDTDIMIRNKMTVMWTNFAKYGNPTPIIDDMITTNWKPMTKSETACLVIDKTIRMKHDVYPQRIKLFQELFRRKFGIK